MARSIGNEWKEFSGYAFQTRERAPEFWGVKGGKANGWKLFHREERPALERQYRYVREGACKLSICDWAAFGLSGVIRASPVNLQFRQKILRLFASQEKDEWSPWRAIVRGLVARICDNLIMMHDIQRMLQRLIHLTPRLLCDSRQEMIDRSSAIPTSARRMVPATKRGHPSAAKSVRWAETRTEHSSVGRSDRNLRGSPHEASQSRELSRVTIARCILQ